MAVSSFSLCRQPFLYIALALLAGICTDVWTSPVRWIAAIVAALSIGVSLAFVASGRNTGASVAILVAFFAFGLLLSERERSAAANAPLKLLCQSDAIKLQEPVELTGTLAMPPEPAPGSFYLDLEAESILQDAEALPVNGRILLIVPLADAEARRQFAALDLFYGTRLRVPVRLERDRGYHNPGSLDFNDFLERRGYQLAGSIKSPLLIERLGDTPVNPVLAALSNFRLGVIRSIDANVRPPASGTLKAMFVDSRYFLDSRTAEQLREGGTFHIISISGTHVGIIAMALLGGMTGARRRGRLWVALVIMALWIYGFMVGLGPPVTRATAMISIGLVGPLLFRRAASINTVGLAAFGMLALKPSLAADPGFQLSLAAVAGIVALALPLAERLRSIGEWRPTAATPHPPNCLRATRRLAEAVFWDERAFREEMRRAPISFRLDKSRAARILGTLRAQRIVRASVLLVVTSIAVQLATLPLTVLYFNRVAPVGVLLNIIAGLVTVALMAAGTLALIAGVFSHWLGSLFGSVASAAHFILANSVVPFSDSPLASFRTANYAGWSAVVYGLYFIPLAMLSVLIDQWNPLDRGSESRLRSAALEASGSENVLAQPHASASRRRRGVAWLICSLSLATVAALVLHPLPPRATGKLAIHFLDVGQGDSALVVFPGGSTMLVDAGGEIEFRGSHRNRAGPVDDIETAESQRSQTDDQLERNRGGSSFRIGEAVVSRYLWASGRTRVDYVLGTHAHEDHIGGLFQVADNFDLGEAIFGHRPTDNNEFDRLLDRMARHRVPIAEVCAGESFEIEGVKVEVLWPQVPSGMPVTSGNNDSVVLRLVFGSVAVLLAGDIEQSAETALVQSGVDLRADVLKAPHHGSKTSSTQPFIEAVNPRYTVLSVGERSRFGHPNPEVVARYRAREVNILQTGLQGTISIETNGSILEVSTFRK